MSKHKDKDNLEIEDVVEQMQEEVIDVENDDWSINEDKLEDAIHPEWEIEQEQNSDCKDILLKTQADFANFKARVERDKSDMVFFLKQDILKKVLPSLDDLERIIKSSSKKDKDSPIYEGLLALQKKLSCDLEKMWVKHFKSLWEEVNPDRHDVMTTLVWKPEWIICDEFEKWYLLDSKVLRHSKVIVWAWE